MSSAPSTTLATSTKSTSSSAPTTTAASSGSNADATIALSTTFTPASACTSSQLTMMSNYFVWINDPLPVPGSTFSSCYPTQWIADYSSVEGSLSSIAPLVTSLVCPYGWDTASSVSTGSYSGYFACCPSEYDLTPPSTTVDTDRPFYGGTCFSTFTAGNTYTVSTFDSSSLVGTQQVTFSNGDAAYGHPIDGWVRAVAISTTTSKAGSSSSGSTNVSENGGATSLSAAAGSGGSSSGLSGGAIAGIVVGVIAGVALLGLAAWAILRRHHKASASAAAASEEAKDEDATSPGGATVTSNEIQGNEINELGGESKQVHEASGDAKGNEGGWYGGNVNRVEMDGRGVHDVAELEGESPGGGRRY